MSEQQSEKTKIDKNDAVVVIHEGWELTGKQGRVVEFREKGTDPEDPDSTIGVRLQHHQTYPHNGVVFFAEEDLRVMTTDDQQDISTEQLLNTLFGSNMWHYYSKRVDPLMIGFAECDYDGCDRTVLLRILVNNHGAIYEYDTCAEHAKYHGRNCDGFPGGRSDAHYTTVFDRDPWTNPKEKPKEGETVIVKITGKSEDLYRVTTGCHFENPDFGVTVGWHLNCLLDAHADYTDIIAVVASEALEANDGWTRDENILGWMHIPR